MLRAVEETVAESPDASLRDAATYDALMARSAQLSKRGIALVELRDRLTSPLLATRTNDFAQTTHYLAYLAASRAGAAHLQVQDRSYYERGIYVGTRARELARRAAVAECADDGSREQSPAWKDAAAAKVASLRGSLAPCFGDALARDPGHPIALTVKIRIGADGHVVVAGPEAPFDLVGGGFTVDFAHCVVSEVEKVVFPRPSGEAIVVVPLEHAGS